MNVDIRDIRNTTVCPECDAGPGEFCRNRHGGARVTMHVDRLIIYEARRREQDTTREAARG